MELKWEPYWYDLDQTIILGDKDFFYLNNKGTGFANGFASTEDKEVLAEVVKISHSDLGEVLGILAYGLSYKFFLEDGSFIQVDSEQEPGLIEHSTSSSLNVSNWVFKIELNVLEETGFSSKMRLDLLYNVERNRLKIEREEKYRRLLNIDSL